MTFKDDSKKEIKKMDEKIDNISSFAFKIIKEAKRDSNNINDSISEGKNNQFINIEDLMLLEEKYNDVLISIKVKSNITNECLEFINFYNQSSLFNNFENYLLTTVYLNPYVDKKINDKSRGNMWLPKFPYYRIKLSLININAITSFFMGNLLFSPITSVFTNIKTLFSSE